MQKFYAPYPVVDFYRSVGVHDLVDKILAIEDISEKLLKEIGKVLGKRWMKRRRYEYKKTISR